MPVLIPKELVKLEVNTSLSRADNFWYHSKKKKHLSRIIIAARALATYLIPGCVGRGVRLGSEGSSVGGGGVGGGGGGGVGVWKSRCFGQNKNFRFLTHSRDLGAILPPN